MTDTAQEQGRVEEAYEWILWYADLIDNTVKTTWLDEPVDMPGVHGSDKLREAARRLRAEIDRLKAAFREAACFCGPVDNPDPTVHREDCAYRVTMERTEAKLEGEND